MILSISCSQKKNFNPDEVWSGAWMLDHPIGEKQEQITLKIIESDHDKYQIFKNNESTISFSYNKDNGLFEFQVHGVDNSIEFDVRFLSKDVFTYRSKSTEAGEKVKASSSITEDMYFRKSSVDSYRNFLKHFSDQYFVNADFVNLREGPSIDSKKTGQLKITEKVEIIKKSSKQVRIKDTNGYWIYISAGKQKGWIFSKYLSGSKGFKPVDKTNTCSISGGMGDYFFIYSFNGDGTYKRNRYRYSGKKTDTVKGRVFKNGRLVFVIDDYPEFQLNDPDPYYPKEILYIGKDKFLHSFYDQGGESPSKSDKPFLK